MRYEGMVYRPPSEAYSLIIQVTIGCSQNRCTFCSMYKNKQFRIRNLKEIFEDFAAARRMYGRVEKIFLADGDALICRMEELRAILTMIKEDFPECRQVTCYASPKSILLKSDEELKELHSLGLSMVYVGLESGNEEVLRRIQKGVTAEEMIMAAGKVKKAGIRLSVTAISGLGGKELWKEHAVDTGKVLSAMKPDYIGLLTLMIEPGVPMEEEIRRGELVLLSSDEILMETRLMIEHMDAPGAVFRSNHASNYVILKGTLNHDKEALLAKLDQALEGKIRKKAEWMRGL